MRHEMPTTDNLLADEKEFIHYFLSWLDCRDKKVHKDTWFSLKSPKVSRWQKLLCAWHLMWHSSDFWDFEISECLCYQKVLKLFESKARIVTKASLCTNVMIAIICFKSWHEPEIPLVISVVVVIVLTDYSLLSRMAKYSLLYLEMFNKSYLDILSVFKHCVILSIANTKDCLWRPCFSTWHVLSCMAEVVSCCLSPWMVSLIHSDSVVLLLESVL